VRGLPSVYVSYYAPKLYILMKFCITSLHINVVVIVDNMSYSVEYVICRVKTLRVLALYILAVFTPSSSTFRVTKRLQLTGTSM